MAEVDDRLNQIQAQINALQAELRQVNADADIAEADRMAEDHNDRQLEAEREFQNERLNELERENGELWDWDKVEMPDPENPFYDEGEPNEDYPLEVIVDPDEPLRVAVRGGTWTVCNRENSGASAFDITGTTDTFGISTNGDFSAGAEASDTTSLAVAASDLSASKTYWVYVRLETGSFAGDAAKATRMNAYLVHTTMPSEEVLAYQNDSLRILRKFTTDSDGVPTLGDVWTRGNIKTQPKTFDSSDPIDPKSTGGSRWRRESLGVNADGCDEVYGFEQAFRGEVPYATADIGEDKALAWRPAVTMDGSSTDGTEQYVKSLGDAADDESEVPTQDWRFINWNLGTLDVGSFAGYPPGFLDIDSLNPTTEGGIDIWAYMLAYFVAGEPVEHNHEEHIFNFDDHDGSVGGGSGGLPARYIRNDGTAIRNNMSGFLGDNAASPKNSVAPNVRVLYDTDGTTPTVDWANATLNGKPWTVTDTTEAGDGTGAFLVPDGGGYFGEGVFVDGISSGYAGIFNSQDDSKLAFLSSNSWAGVFDDGSNVMGLCDGARAALATGDIEISGTSGDYKHNSLTGHTDTDNGVSGGIVVSGTGLPGGAQFEGAVNDLIDFYL